MGVNKAYWVRLRNKDMGVMCDRGNQSFDDAIAYAEQQLEENSDFNEADIIVVEDVGVTVRRPKK